MRDHLMKIDCFMAAICRDKAEGGDGTRYFGSLGTYNSHLEDARYVGLVGSDDALTDKGLAVGQACRVLPDGRAYVYHRLYEEAAETALRS